MEKKNNDVRSSAVESKFFWLRCVEGTTFMFQRATGEGRKRGDGKGKHTVVPAPYTRVNERHFKALFVVLFKHIFAAPKSLQQTKIKPSFDEKSLPICCSKTESWKGKNHVSESRLEWEPCGGSFLFERSTSKSGVKDATTTWKRLLFSWPCHHHHHHYEELSHSTHTHARMLLLLHLPNTPLEHLRGLTKVEIVKVSFQPW